MRLKVRSKKGEKRNPVLKWNNALAGSLYKISGRERFFHIPVPAWLVLIYAAVSLIGMAIDPAAFVKYFNGQGCYDAFSYRHIALNGYSGAPQWDSMWAFFPLWPLVIQYAIAVPSSLLFPTLPLFLGMNIMSFLLFSFSVFLFYRLSRKFLGLSGAFIITAAYTINPLSVFRVNGYSESLFSVLCLLAFFLILGFLKKRNVWNILGTCIITGLMSLTRNVTTQFVLASLCSLLTVTLVSYGNSAGRSPKHLLQAFTGHIPEAILTALISISVIAGYAVYGLHGLNLTHDFFHAFTVQKNWGKVFGLYPLNFIFPPTWGGPGPLLWDILALYLPLVILVLVLIKIVKTIIFHKPAGTKEAGLPVPSDYLFWFSLYFCFWTGMIVAFTQSGLNSLSRYVFAVPFIYYAFISIVKNRPHEKTYRLAPLYFLVCVVFIFAWWVTYGLGWWMG